MLCMIFWRPDYRLKTLATLGLLFSFAAVSATEKPLRIAIASSLAPVVESLDLDAQTLQVTAAASGVLHAQILRGADYDLFISADPKYLDALQTAGKVQARHRHCIAQANIGLVSQVGTNQPDLALLRDKKPAESLHNEPAIRLVHADPTLAPFGRAAEQILKRQSSSRPSPYKSIQARSAAQTLQYLVTGHAQVAILPVHLAVRHDLPFALIPHTWHDPVIYEAGITSSNNQSAAQKVIAVLRQLTQSTTREQYQSCRHG